MEIFLYLGWIVALIFMSLFIWSNIRNLAQRSKNISLVKDIEFFELKIKELENKNSFSLVNQLKDYISTALMESIFPISNKLIAEHKIETESNRNITEDSIKKVTKNLLDDFQTVLNQMSKMDDKINSSNNIVDKLNSTLNNPIKGGHLSEIILANTLESFGLLKDRDYFLQMSIGEYADKRPDAIIKIPPNTIVVIDSKFSVALFEEEDKKLRRSILSHIKILASKKYEDQFMQEEEQQIITIMWFSQDSFVDKMYRAVADISTIAMKNHIFICGPSSLFVILGFLSQQIFLANVSKNSRVISDNLQELFEFVQEVSNNYSVLGKNIKKTSSQYKKLDKIMNTKLLSTIEKLKQIENN